jgi:hypothetical protein
MTIRLRKHIFEKRDMCREQNMLQERRCTTRTLARAMFVQVLSGLLLLGLSSNSFSNTTSTDRTKTLEAGSFTHGRKIDTGDALLAQSNQQKPPSQGGPSYTPSYDINKAMGMGSKGGAGVSAAAPNKGTATGKDPIKVFGDAEEAGWDLSEREKQGVRLAVEYLRKKAAEKAESDPDMANLLEMYAQRILIAKIDRADKPFLASGQASTSRFTGTITLYDSFIDGNGNTFNLTPRPLENYDKRELEEIAGVASSLMHEVAHSLAGASEWQSHLLQKITFDALDISEEKDIRKFNKNYFETFDSPLDPRSEFQYVFWVQLHENAKNKKQVQNPETNSYWGSNPKF